MSIVKLGAIGSSLFLFALILNGCARAGGAGGGGASPGAPQTALVNGALPGPPTDGGSSPPPNVVSGSTSNVISGPPPDSLGMSDPSMDISEDSSPSNPVASSPESETPKPNTHNVLAMLNISSISAADPGWSKSWLSRGSDQLSDKAPQWLIPHAANQQSSDPFSARFCSPCRQSLLEARIKATNS